MDVRVEAFLEMLAAERGAARNTLAAYEADLTDVAGWLRRKGGTLDGASPEALRAYLAGLTGAGLSARTVARRLSALRQFFRFLAREGMRGDDPTALLDAPRQGRLLPKALTEGQIEALLAAPDTDDVEGLRDRAMLELMYACGLRASEVGAICTHQVHPRLGTVLITGKGGKQRLVPMGKPALDAVDRYLEQCRPLLTRPDGRDKGLHRYFIERADVDEPTREDN